MIYHFYFAVLLLLSADLAAQSVGINTSTPHASSVLDMKSDSKGMLVPRTSSASRIAISNPAKGLLIYDTTTSSFWFYSGNEWIESSHTKNGWSLNGNSSSGTGQFIGYTNNQPLIFKTNNVISGYIDPESRNTSFGHNTMTVLTTGVYNTAIGYSSMASLSSGFYNTAVGFEALSASSSGAYNTAVGMQAMKNASGSYNTAIGIYSHYNGSGSYNTSVGTYSLTNISSGSNNTALGYESLTGNTLGINNTAVGMRALKSNINGVSNVAIGHDAMLNAAHSGGNVAIGSEALQLINAGSNNIAIGTRSGIAAGFNLAETINFGNHDWLNGATGQALIGGPGTTFIGGYRPWSNVSDERGKFNIQDNVKGLDFILKLKPVTYQVNIENMMAISGNKPSGEYPQGQLLEKEVHTGFLAQQVEKAAAEAGFIFDGVTKIQSVKPMYALSYSSFVGPLVKAVQEQQEIIVRQQQQIDDLVKRLSSLETKIN